MRILSGFVGDVPLKCADAPADLSGPALKAYAASCGQDAAIAYVKTEVGVDPTKFIKNGQVNWNEVGGAIITYETGAPIDANVFEADGSLNYRVIVKDAGSIAAAAVCTAYGLGAVAPICGVVGGALGQALYDLGKDFLGLFESAPPYVDPSPFASVNEVAKWYSVYAADYIKNFASARGVVLVQIQTAFTMALLWSKATKTNPDMKAAWNRLVDAGMKAPVGWHALLGLESNWQIDVQAVNEKVLIKEVAICRILFGFSQSVWDLSGQKVNGGKDSYEGWKGAFSKPPHGGVADRFFYVYGAQGGIYIGAMSDSDDRAAYTGFSRPWLNQMDRYGDPILWVDPVFGAGGTGGGSNPNEFAWNTYAAPGCKLGEKNSDCAVAGWAEEVTVTTDLGLRQLLMAAPTNFVAMKTEWVKSIQPAVSKFLRQAAKARKARLANEAAAKGIGVGAALGLLAAGFVGWKLIGKRKR